MHICGREEGRGGDQTQARCFARYDQHEMKVEMGEAMAASRQLMVICDYRGSSMNDASEIRRWHGIIKRMHDLRASLQLRSDRTPTGVNPFSPAAAA